MLKVFTKKRFWKKLCTVLLCLVLCFTLVVNTCVDCFAVAGVDDGLFLLLLVIFASCGITFASLESAHHGVDAFTSSASSGTMDLINSKLGVYTAGVAVLQKIGDANISLQHVGISFLAEEWKKIIADVVAVFGTYTALDVVIDLTSQLDNNILSMDNSLGWKWYVTADNYNKVSCNKFIFEFIGSNSSAAESLPSVLGKPSNGINSVSIGDFTFYSYNSYSSTAPIPVFFSVSKSYNSLIGFNFNGQSLGITSKYLYYKGNPVTATKVGQGYRLSTSICADIGKSLNLSDSICPDCIFSENTFADWLLNLGNGVIGDDIPSVGALPGSPSIDTTAYPGSDTWHDGSINDDVATGNPSIGISVPTDVSDDDIATLNPSKARDYSNADVKDKDVTTDDKDKPGDKDDKDKTGTTPNIPAIGLPEILFKEKFPFCLPWDLYNLFAGLNTSAEAPKFVIPFKIERFGIDESITIDLSEFTEQVKIVRFFIGAGFVLALILISRKMIGAE